MVSGLGTTQATVNRKPAPRGSSSQDAGFRSKESFGSGTGEDESGSKEKIRLSNVLAISIIREFQQHENTPFPIDGRRSLQTVFRRPFPRHIRRHQLRQVVQRRITGATGPTPGGRRGFSG